MYSPAAYNVNQSYLNYSILYSSCWPTQSNTSTGTSLVNMAFRVHLVCDSRGALLQQHFDMLNEWDSVLYHTTVLKGKKLLQLWTVGKELLLTDRADKIYLFGGICNLTAPFYSGNRRFFWPPKRRNFLATELAQIHISIYEEARDNGLLGKIAILPEFGADLIRYNDIDQPNSWMCRAQKELDENLPLLHATTKDVNKHLGSLTPWTLDAIYRCTKKGIRYPKYSLLSDGLHPSDEVAKRIVMQILKDIDDLFTDRLSNIYILTLSHTWFSSNSILFTRMRTAVFHLPNFIYTISNEYTYINLVSLQCYVSEVIIIMCYFYPYSCYKPIPILSIYYTGIDTDVHNIYICSEVSLDEPVLHRALQLLPKSSLTCGAIWRVDDANSRTTHLVSFYEVCHLHPCCRCSFYILNLQSVNGLVSEQQCSSLNAKFSNLRYITIYDTSNSVTIYNENHDEPYRDSIVRRLNVFTELKILKFMCIKATSEQQCSSPNRCFIVPCWLHECCQSYYANSTDCIIMNFILFPMLVYIGEIDECFLYQYCAFYGKAP